MTTDGSRHSKSGGEHWLITDSGLGGLGVCAEVERCFRRLDSGRNLQITYFNAWPEPGRGYNDLPDPPSRARVFNRALSSMNQFKPDRILIACNTLSVLYPMTEFSRSATIPVLGIIDAGVALFVEALEADPSGSIVLFGTRITIESGVHRERLLQKGIDGRRIAAVSCHGLAAAIEKDPDGEPAAGLLEQCAGQACRGNIFGEPVYVGLCCTHYSYVKERFRSVLERHTGKRIRILDPRDRMVRWLALEKGEAAGEAEPSPVVVEVISRVELTEHQRRAVAGLVAPVSEVTARALLSYTWRPGLF